VSISL